MPVYSTLKSNYKRDSLSPLLRVSADVHEPLAVLGAPHNQQLGACILAAFVAPILDQYYTCEMRNGPILVKSKRDIGDRGDYEFLE